MSKAASENGMARLEARIPAEVYSRMRRAAELRGMTLTGYLLATAGEDARRTVEEADIMRLSQADQVRFAESLIDPPKANKRLRDAARIHDSLIRKR